MCYNLFVSKNSFYDFILALIHGILIMHNAYISCFDVVMVITTLNVLIGKISITKNKRSDYSKF